MIDDATAAVLAPRTPPEPQWRRSAPSLLIRAFTSGNAAEFARRMRLRPPFQSASKRLKQDWIAPYQQVLWSQSAYPETERSRLLCELLRTGPETEGRRGFAQREAAIRRALDSSGRGPDPNGFELLSWLTILLFEKRLPPDLFVQLWKHVWHGMRDLLATPQQLAGRLTDDQRTLLTGELPWAYALVFSDLKGARRLRHRAAAILAAELRQSCDEEGMPHAVLLDRLPLRLASFVRATSLGKVLGKDWRDTASKARFRKLVLRAAALLNPTGETALSQVSAPADAVLAAAMPLAEVKKAHPAARWVSHSASARENGTCGQAGLPQGIRAAVPRLRRKHRPAAESDSARLACLRNNWGPGADACVIAFDDDRPRMDLTAFGIPVLRGEWGCTVVSGGGEWSLKASGWECVCWFSDGMADFVELQQTVPGVGRLLRQALLSRTDHFLLLCDIVRAEGDRQDVRHTVQLPLREAGSAVQDAVTREWAVRTGPLRIRVLPLGLAQESLDRTDGRISIDRTRIVLTQESTGGTITSPLLLDWSPARRKAPAQWKRLTVAEGGRILGTSDAFAVRWRLGDAQWMYYHALSERETARTVLGLHTFHETVIAELTGAGDVEPIVQVESATAPG